MAHSLLASVMSTARTSILAIAVRLSAPLYAETLVPIHWGNCMTPPHYEGYRTLCTSTRGVPKDFGGNLDGVGPVKRCDNISTHTTAASDGAIKESISERVLLSHRHLKSLDNPDFPSQSKQHFELHESDVREHFQRGHGPGGQKVNKTNNCVLLTHMPTGITVRCHETRSQLKNRKIARDMLRARVAEQLLGADHHAEDEIRKVRKRKTDRRRQASRKRDKVDALLRAASPITHDVDQP